MDMNTGNEVPEGAAEIGMSILHIATGKLRSDFNRFVPCEADQTSNVSQEAVSILNDRRKQDMQKITQQNFSLIKCQLKLGLKNMEIK